MPDDIYDDQEEDCEYCHGPGKLYVGSYRVDPRYLVDLLGFEPSPKLRLPIEPIRKVIKAAAEAWLNLLRDRGLGSNPTPEQVRAASPVLQAALLDLYVHLSTYGARRCPAPIPKQYPLIRQLFRGLIDQIHRAVPGGSPLNIEVIFIGKEVEDDAAEVLQAKTVGDT